MNFFKHPKISGNVSVTVIMIMIVSSFLGLLTMQYVQNLLKVNSSYYQYYRAYYLAKWAADLALLKVQNQPIGFQDSILSGSETVKNNVSCLLGRCFFEYQILAISPILSDEILDFSQSCELSKKISLAPWESEIIPLFGPTGITGQELPVNSPYQLSLSSDLAQSQIETVFSGAESIGIWLVLNSSGWLDTFYQQNPSFESFQIASWFDVATKANSLIKTYFSALNPDLLNKDNYLVITNFSSVSTLDFCLQTEIPLPTRNVVIQSKGYFLGKEINLTAIRKITIPSFVLSSFTELSP